MLELSAGTHEAANAGLRFHLTAPLALASGSLLVLCGENGAGKSTFLERVLIPSARSTHRILYLAQDMDLQRHTMAATLALLGQEVPVGITSLALAWIQACPSRDTLILDEFEKYLRPEQRETLDRLDFSWVVKVSHLCETRPRTQHRRGFRLLFERTNAGPDVDVRLEQAW